MDPVLAMLGVGAHLWEAESGDLFVDRLRSEDAPGLQAPGFHHAANEQADAVWERIVDLQGQLFHTATGLPFTFEIDGPGIWFFRDGNRVNRKLSRAQFEIALSRCPLTSTTEIKDLIDYSYLYALLMDKRVRGQSW